MLLIQVKPRKEKSLSRVLMYIGIGLLVLFLLLLLFLYLIQDRIAFNAKGKSTAYHHPNSSYKDYYLPSELGMTYKNLTIMSPVNPHAPGYKQHYDKLYGWFVYHEGISDQIPTIVYFHENDYFPPARLYMIEKLYKNPQKYNVIMVDYRGYGYSQGSPTEQGVLTDSRAIMDYVLSMEEIDKDQVFIFGASIGGVMATYSATVYQDRVQGLILQNTIASVKSLLVDKLPIVEPILPLVLKLKMKSVERITHIRLPLMFIVGLKDTSTGPHQMELLYDAAEESATWRDLYVIPDSEHYLTWYYGGEEFDTRLTSYIDKALAESGKSLAKSESKNMLATVYDFGFSVKSWLEEQTQ